MSFPRNILLVGCGRWGVLILRDLVELGAKVTVVARSEESRARATAFAGVRAVPSIAAAEHAGQYAGAIVAANTTQHFSVISELLERFPAVSIFTEKCLCPNLEHASRLAEIGAGRVFVMDKWRYHPGVEALAEIARAGELGRIMGIKTQRLGWGSGHRDVDPLWILLPHDLAIVLEIAGEIPPVEAVVAQHEGAVAYTMNTLLRSDSGLWVAIDTSSRATIDKRMVTIFAEHGSAMLDDSYADYITVARASGSFWSKDAVWEKRSVGDAMPLKRELESFLLYVHGAGPVPRSSAVEGALIVRRIHEMRVKAGIPMGDYERREGEEA